MKVYDRVSVDQWFLATIGVLILVMSTAGLWYAGRAAWAARLSYRAQHGFPQPDVEQILDWSQRAFSLYPYNYYLSIFAAETAYYRAGDVREAARTERLRRAQLWCDRGLEQNGYKSQLRRLKTRFLWEESPAEAIGYWEAYTDWHYWEPYNHATLAELYAKAGDFEKAGRELNVIANFPGFHAEAFRSVEKEKKLWDESLNENTGEWGE